VAVAPGVELRGSAQRLAGADVAGALLGMVDDEDGKGVAALQLAQVGEQRGDLAAGVLVDPVQAHEGVEDQQFRLQPGNGFLQSDPIGGKSEGEGGGGGPPGGGIAPKEAPGGGGAAPPPPSPLGG